MLPTVVIVAAGACLFGVGASIVMAWASNRSAAWNMMFGVVCGLAALLAAVLIALLLTRSAFPH